MSDTLKTGTSDKPRSLQRKVLIVVENLPVPLDRRVWLEATTLTANGYLVSVICPTGRSWNKLYEEIDGVQSQLEHVQAADGNARPDGVRLDSRPA